MRSTITSLKRKIVDLEKKNAIVTEPAPMIYSPEHSSSSSNSDDSNVDDNKPPTNNTDNIHAVVATYINVEKEKAKIRLNVIVHNVSESLSEDGLTRKNYDVDFVTKMRQTRLVINTKPL